MGDRQTIETMMVPSMGPGVGKPPSSQPTLTVPPPAVNVGVRHFFGLGSMRIVFDAEARRHRPRGEKAQKLLARKENQWQMGDSGLAV